jgi:hypothetical protein
MRNMKLFFAILFGMTLGTQVFAQNGNLVVSEIKIYDDENGQAVLEAQISGNLSGDVTSADIIVEGPGVMPSRATFSRVLDGQGNQVHVALAFPYRAPGTGNNPYEFLDVTFRLRRLGNGLDYTYSARARPRRHHGI